MSLAANQQVMYGKNNDSLEDHFESEAGDFEDGHLDAEPEHGEAGSAVAFQPEFHYRGFMQFKNDEKSGTTLCGQLSQLARMVPSFHLLGYTDSETTEVADFLIQYGVFTLRHLVDKKTVFHGANPTWPIDQEEGSREVALLLHEALIQDLLTLKFLN